MTIPRHNQRTLNMIAAWTGAIATLATLIVKSPLPMAYAGLPTTVILAAIVALILFIIARLKPVKVVTVALSGGLGVAFSALTYFLIQ